LLAGGLHCSVGSVGRGSRSNPYRTRRRSGAVWPPLMPSTMSTSLRSSAAPRNPSSTSTPTSTTGPFVRLFLYSTTIRSDLIGSFFSDFTTVCWLIGSSRVYEDEEEWFREIFAGFKKEEAIQNQYEFVVQRMGGPPLFSQRKGT
jgi:hypothetical protein